MPTNTVKLQAATADDAPAMIELVYSSGPATFEYIFSSDRQYQAKDFLAYALQQPHGSLSYSLHQVMSFEQQIIATVMSKTSHHQLKEMFANIKVILSFYGVKRGIGVLIRGMKVETMIKHPVKNRLYIGHLGVKPHLRGQGIGRDLIQQMSEIAKERNIQYLALDVATENPMAQALYEELGFVTKAFRPFNYQQPKALPVSDHHYMEYLIK